MFPLLHQLQRLLLSAPKWCSPSRLLQYLLALCRVVFRRCKLKRSVHNLNHEFPLPMTSTIVERKESLSGESMANAIAAGHATSSSYSPVQPQGSVSAAVEAGSVQNHDKFPSCVPNKVLPILYADPYHLQVYINVNLLSNKAYIVYGPRAQVLLAWYSCSIIPDSFSAPLLLPKSKTKAEESILMLKNGTSSLACMPTT